MNARDRKITVMIEFNRQRSCVISLPSWYCEPNHVWSCRKRVSRGLKYRAVGIIPCVYLIWTRLASGLMPQFIRGINNVLPPSLSDSNWLENLGAEIATASVVAGGTLMAEMQFSKGISSIIWLRNYDRQIERSMLPFMSWDIWFTVHNGLVK